jgi:hypothetical protein
MSLRMEDFKYESIASQDKLVFEFDVAGGWMDLKIVAGEVTIELRPSYLTDVLDNLLEAVVDILPAYAERDKYFDAIRTRSRSLLNLENKGIVILDFLREDNDTKILIRDNPDLDMEIDDFYTYYKFDDAIARVNGNILLAVKVRTNHFIHALIQGTNELLNKYGAVGYQERWMKHEFPLGYLNKLKAVKPDSDGCEIIKQPPNQ